MSKRLVQYEFKIILRADEEAWPHELRHQVQQVLETMASEPILKIVSVERIEDYR